MLRPIRFALLLVLLALAFDAQGQAASELRVSTPQTEVTVAEKRPLPLRFTVVHKGARSLTLREQVKPPAGWRVLQSNTDFEVAPGDSLVRLVTLLPPANATAGLRALRYRLFGPDGKVAGEQQVMIRVPERLGLGIQVVEQERFVLPGSESRIRLRVANRSNRPVTVDLTVDGHERLFSRDHASVSLGIGESRELALRVTAARTELRRQRDVPLWVNARIRGSQVTEQVRVLYRLMQPTQTSGADFHRYPASIGVLAGADHYPGAADENTFLMLQANGEGALREGGSDRLQFQIQTDNLTGGRSYYRDLYRMELTGDRYALRAGDAAYTFMPLLDRYPYMFGGSGEVEFGALRTGAFYAQDRDALLNDGERAGVTIGLGSAEALGVGLVAERWSGTQEATVAGARIQGAALASAFQLQAATAELDDGTQATAFGGRVETDLEYINSRIYGRSLSAAYPGRFNVGGEREIGGSFQVYPGGRWLLDSQYEYTHRFSIDRHRFAASIQPGRWLRASYYGTLASGGRLAGSFRGDEAELRLRLEPGPLEITAETALGRIDDGTGEVAHPRRVRLEGSYGFHSHLRFEAGLAWRTGGSVLTITRSRREDLTARAGLALQPFEHASLHLSGSLSRSGYANLDQQTYRLESRFTYRLPFGHRLTLRGSAFRYDTRYSAFTEMRARTGWRAHLGYVVPLAIPLHRSDKSGYVHGRLTSEESGEGIPGVTLYLAGLASVTDEEGRFHFASVRPGPHELRARRADLGLERDFVGAMPRQVVVVGGEETEVFLSAFATSVIEGRVLLDDEPLGEVVVQVDGEEMTMRRTTAMDGSFRLRYLTPGRFRVRLPEAYLPERTIRVDADTTFTLTSGAKQEVTLRLTGARTQIKMVEPVKKKLTVVQYDPEAPPTIECGTSTLDHDYRHRVERDETLYSLAARYYCDPWKWPKIWERNEHVRSPLKLVPGRALVVPADAPLSEQEIRLGERWMDRRYPDAINYYRASFPRASD